MLVKEVMNRVLTAEPGLAVQEAVRKMVDNRIGCLVIVKNNIVKGILTESDILKAVAEGGDVREKVVADIMTNYIYSVSPGQNLGAAIRIMNEQRIKKLPVLDGRRLVGIITTTDIVSSNPGMLSELRELMRK